MIICKGSFDHLKNIVLLLNLYTQLCRKANKKSRKAVSSETGVQWNSQQHTFISSHRTKWDCIPKPHRVISKPCCSHGYLYTLLFFILLLSLQGFSPTYQTFKIISKKLIQNSWQYCVRIKFFLISFFRRFVGWGLDFWYWFVLFF